MKRNFCKVLSFLLTFSLVFSCCITSFNVTAVTATHTHNGSNWDGVFHAQTTGMGTQGMASYGEYFFWASPRGEIDVYDVNDTGKITPIATFRLGSYNDGFHPRNFNTEGTETSWWANHSNQMMFGTEKFDESDQFPLLYVTTGSSNAHDGSGAYVAKCAVERITKKGDTWSSETVQIIEFNDFKNIPYEKDNPYKNQEIEKWDI